MIWQILSIGTGSQAGHLCKNERLLDYSSRPSDGPANACPSLGIQAANSLRPPRRTGGLNGVEFVVADDNVGLHGACPSSAIPTGRPSRRRWLGVGARVKNKSPSDLRTTAVPFGSIVARPGESWSLRLLIEWSQVQSCSGSQLLQGLGRLHLTDSSTVCANRHPVVAKGCRTLDCRNDLRAPASIPIGRRQAAGMNSFPSSRAKRLSSFRLREVDTSCATRNWNRSGRPFRIALAYRTTRPLAAGHFHGRRCRRLRNPDRFILKVMVDPEPALARPHHKRSKLFAQMKKSFRDARVLATKDETIESHRVVRSLILDEGLVADFALKNGTMHVIETVDASDDESSPRRTWCLRLRFRGSFSNARG